MNYYRHGPTRPPGMGIGVPRLTPYVKWIVIACVAVWLLQRTVGMLGFDRLTAWFGLVPALVVKGFIWQPATYMFLHSPDSMFHLLFNMLVLWLFGSDLESHWGSRGFLRYYLICGVGAAVFITVLGLFANPNIPTVGASGAIYGVIMAYGMIFAQRTILFMMIFPMKARTFSIILFAIAFISTFDSRGGGVSHVAHLGGAVTGYLYLKRAWRFGDFYREMRWKLKRRRFKVMPPSDQDDHWIN